MQTDEISSFKSNNIKLRSNRCFLSFFSIATCTSSIAISDSRRLQLLYNLFSPLRRRYNHLRIHTRLNVSATVKPVTVSYVTGSFAWRNFSDALFLLLFFSLSRCLPPLLPSFFLFCPISFLPDLFRPALCRYSFRQDLRRFLESEAHDRAAKMPANPNFLATLSYISDAQAIEHRNL